MWDRSLINVETLNVICMSNHLLIFYLLQQISSVAHDVSSMWLLLLFFNDVKEFASDIPHVY